MTYLICMMKMKNLFQSHKDTPSSHSQLYGQEESDINVVRDRIINGLMDNVSID
jgi:hypothetical protein